MTSDRIRYFIYEREVPPSAKKGKGTKPQLMQKAYFQVGDGPIKGFRQDGTICSCGVAISQLLEVSQIEFNALFKSPPTDDFLRSFGHSGVVPKPNVRFWSDSRPFNDWEQGAWSALGHDPGDVD